MSDLLGRTWVVFTVAFAAVIIPMQVIFAIERWPVFYATVSVLSFLLFVGNFAIARRRSDIPGCSKVFGTLWLLFSFYTGFQSWGYWQSHYSNNDTIIPLDMFGEWLFVPFLLFLVAVAPITSRVSLHQSS